MAELLETEDSSPELILALDGFEGPIGLLLELARGQKVDLKQISVLALTEQYLVYITGAVHRHFELATDYLVMAAWLTYLKSRLLLPEPPADDEPSGEELAAALRRQLARLAAMQQGGRDLIERPQLGRDVFRRGAPEGLAVTVRPLIEVGLFDLLRSYVGLRDHDEPAILHIDPPPYHSVEEALRRLSILIGASTDWRRLQQFLPPGLAAGGSPRSALAATFVASLELAKSGRAEIRQEAPFGPIHLRPVPR